MKGLLIREDPVAKILDGTKTMEIRNVYCKCIKPGGTFYILRLARKGDAKNSQGQSCVAVVGKVEFEANHFIPHGCFQNFYKDHQVSEDQYRMMTYGWKEKGGAVAWKIKLLEKFDPPKYIAHSHQEGWYGPGVEV